MPKQSFQHYKDRFELAFEEHKKHPPELRDYIPCRCDVDEDDLSDENMPFLTQAIRETEKMPELELGVIPWRMYAKKAHEALIQLAESCPTLTEVIITHVDPNLRTQREQLKKRLEENKKKLQESKKLSKSAASVEPEKSPNAVGEESKKGPETISAHRSLSLTPPPRLAPPRIESDQPGGSDYGM